MDLLLFATIVFNLFLIIDPIGCLPLFIVFTKDNTEAQRRAMVLRATVIAFFVLTLFALIGNPLLGYFHISVPAMQIAGGILLFIIGLEMLYGSVTKTEYSDPEQKEAIEKKDISITPLAIPLLAGPGAITAVMLFSGSGGWSEVGVVILAVLVVMVASWILLRLSTTMCKLLGNIGIKVIGRVMGLLLVFMAAQFVIDGLSKLGIVKII
jgi:multiple antibiotic resistance protein